MSRLRTRSGMFATLRRATRSCIEPDASAVQFRSRAIPQALTADVASTTGRSVVAQASSIAAWFGARFGVAEGTR